MALVTISNVAIPVPTEFQVGLMDVSNAARNASGYMIIERIATKRKLFFTYSYIVKYEASMILRLIAPTTYTVTYIDPQDDVTKSGQFYCGDRQIGYISYRNGIPVYKDFTFNLIEL